MTNSTENAIVSIFNARAAYSGRDIKEYIFCETVEQEAHSLVTDEMEEHVTTSETIADFVNVGYQISKKIGSTTILTKRLQTGRNKRGPTFDTSTLYVASADDRLVIFVGDK